MSDKEMLEEIKKELELYWSNIFYVVNQDDMKWLINRVEELELELNDWRAEVQKWQQFYEESEESHLETKELLKSIVNQNKRLREALEFYADENNYSVDISKLELPEDIFYAEPPVVNERGIKARQALGREE